MADHKTWNLNKGLAELSSGVESDLGQIKELLTKSFGNSRSFNNRFACRVVMPSSMTNSNSVSTRNSPVESNCVRNAFGWQACAF